MLSQVRTVILNCPTGHMCNTVGHRLGGSSCRSGQSVVGSRVLAFAFRGMGDDDAGATGARGWVNGERPGREKVRRERVEYLDDERERSLPLVGGRAVPARAAGAVRTADDAEVAVLLLDTRRGLVTYANPEALALTGGRAQLPVPAAEWTAAARLVVPAWAAGRRGRPARRRPGLRRGSGRRGAGHAARRPRRRGAAQALLGQRAASCSRPRTWPASGPSSRCSPSIPGTARCAPGSPRI